MRLTILLLCSLFALSSLRAQPVGTTASSLILTERDRARIIDDVLEDRFTNLLPQLMRREGIDMWVIISREYNEDPVLKTMLPSTWLSARRRTIMVFFDK
ncbi:MAG TPA: Xaa-Pro aminopeptidase, partial [Fibrella sp.]